MWATGHPIPRSADTSRAPYCATPHRVPTDGVHIVGPDERGTRVGAVVYNLFHTYLPPAVLAIFGVWAGARLPVLVALVWFAHIGMDRMLGYGLKHTSGFRDTHLGRIGRARERRSAGG